MEKAVVIKEQASSAYRLSAYFVSKFLSELPLNLLGPALFGTLLYWIVDCAFVVYVCGWLGSIDQRKHPRTYMLTYPSITSTQTPQSVTASRSTASSSRRWA